jgi:hypothetical protein
VTEALHAYLNKQVQELKDSWSAGNYTHTDPGVTMQANAKAIGLCQAAEGILYLDYEELMRIYEEEH